MAKNRTYNLQLSEEELNSLRGLSGLDPVVRARLESASPSQTGTDEDDDDGDGNTSGQVGAMGTRQSPSGTK